jgi:hypothetical protein
MSQIIVFNSSKWLNGQHRYPKANIPKDILNERRRLLRIPLFYAGFIPSSKISIHDLLDSTSLPVFDNHLALHPNNNPIFSSRPADTNLPYDLTARAIPSVTSTSALLLSFGQHWFDGAQSLVDPREPSQSLPFWVLQYWNRLGLVLEAKHAWHIAHTWVISCASPLHPQFHVVQKVLTSFKILGWNVVMKGAAGGTTSLEWAEFLLSTAIKLI